MTTTLVTVRESASVVEAARLMKKSRIGSLLVTDDDGKIYGILTADDIVGKAVAFEKTNEPVKAFASKPLLCVPMDADLSEAAELMGKKNVKRLIVTGPGGRISGLISDRDIVKISPSLYDLIAERERLKA